MPATADIRGVRISPRKVAVVAALVKGRSVADAITILEHTPRRAAQAVKQAVKSAGANAERHKGLKPDSLFISEISVKPGMRLKRYRPAAHGRALRFQRKTSHILVVIDGEARPVKAKAKAETKAEAK